MVDVLIIGGGLIGSAAARHLSEFGAAVALMDPGEPVDWAHDLDAALFRACFR